MATNRSQEIVDQYYTAWTSNDFVGARSLLHNDLSFHGPIDRFDNADDYMRAITRLASIVQGIEKHMVFVDGQDVCVIYDLITATPAGAAPVAEWFTIKDDKIAAIRVFFDARPFAPPAQH